jgi:predicted nucleotidyltransferase
MHNGAQRFDAMLTTLRRAAAALRDAGIPFALGGSLACWARGGPESTNDLDLMIRGHDAEAALAALQAAGMRSERPPEDWLYKAWDGDVMVDLIFDTVDRPVDDELIQSADEMQVAAVRMRATSLEDVLSTKLLALGDHSLDYAPLVQIGRSLREAIDWSELKRRTCNSPYARAYFTLLEGLSVIGEHAGPPSHDEVTVRAVEGSAGRPTFGPAKDATR